MICSRGTCLDKDNELLSKFKSLGWGDSQQSQSIFNLLIQARNQVQPDDVILDLGAGECRYRFFFDRCNYVSVDFGKGDKNWDFGSNDIVGDITKLDFIKSESVPYVLNTTVLEHINEPSELFSHIHRILRPGGKLFLYVPFVQFEHQIPFDFYRYTSYGLRYLCEKSGLEVVELAPSNAPLETSLSFLLQSVGIKRTDSPAKRMFLHSLLLSMRFSLFLNSRLWKEEVSREVADSGFPICWTLIARKPGIEDPVKADRIAPTDRKKIIESIVKCPKCKSDTIDLQYEDNYYICPECKEKYPTHDWQIVFG